MKQAITSIEELYGRSSPIGEIIVDAVVEALRGTRILRANELAEVLEVDYRALRLAWELVTGITLADGIRRWRLLQAWELLEAEGYRWEDSSQRCTIPMEVLQRVAVRCGWRSYRTLRPLLKRARTLP